MDNGASNWAERPWLRRQHQTIFSVLLLGTFDNQHFSANGRLIGFPAHASFTLVIKLNSDTFFETFAFVVNFAFQGGIHEQILHRSRISIPTVQLQAHLGR